MVGTFSFNQAGSYAETTTLNACSPHIAAESRLPNRVHLTAEPPLGLTLEYAQTLRFRHTGSRGEDTSHKCLDRPAQRPPDFCGEEGRSWEGLLARCRGVQSSW